MLEMVFGVHSKRTDCSRRPSFFKSFGEVCLDFASMYFKWKVWLGFFPWRPLSINTRQELVFEGSLVLLVLDCCTLVENLAFQCLGLLFC